MSRGQRGNDRMPKRAARVESARRKKAVEEQKKAKQRIKKAKPASAKDIVTAGDLRAYLDITSADWDVIIICDGSGTSWGKSWGSGSVLLQKGQFERPLFHAAGNTGTNNVAELMGVFYPLLWLTSQRAGVSEGGCKVHIISDSEYVVSGINTDTPNTIAATASNRPLWMAIHSCRRQGLILKAHHVHRDILQLNKLSHDLANLARRSQLRLLDELDRDPYQSMPE